MFGLSHHLRDISKSNKMQKFDHGDEGQGQGYEKRNFCSSTESDRFHVGDFLTILATWDHTFMQTGNRHTYTHSCPHIHTQRESTVMTISKICKADVPKIKAYQLHYRHNYVISQMHLSIKCIGIY